MLSPLPRQVEISACVGYFLISLRPSPNIGRVGIHNFPFGASSGFTRVTACRVAAALKAYICPQSFSMKVSLSYRLGSYRDEPTISLAELSSAGILHPRGAPIFVYRLASPHEYHRNPHIHDLMLCEIVELSLSQHLNLPESESHFVARTTG
jgi:hypothetical protein